MGGRDTMVSGADEAKPWARFVAARDLWIFAYGSLMWDPGFAYAEAQPALLKGYHRSFCVYSHRHRGTGRPVVEDEGQPVDRTAHPEAEAPPVFELDLPFRFRCHRSILTQTR